MMARQWMKGTAFLLTGLIGCSTSTMPSDTVGKQDPDLTARSRFAGIEFEPPPGWTTEDIQGGLLLLASEIEGGWQANLFLEVRDDPDARSLEQAIDELVPNLRASKQGFREVSRTIETHPNGFRIARVEFTCVNQETAITEWEIVIELGQEKRLFVLASSASGLWGKYQPIFERFIKSLRISHASS